MPSYIIEITQSQAYHIPVHAKSEEEAKEKATKEWNELTAKGLYHYKEHGDPVTEFTNVYDVTGTEDANF